MTLANGTEDKHFVEGRTGRTRVPVLTCKNVAGAGDENRTRTIAADNKIDGLVRDIRAAKEGGYEWASSPFYLDLALRKLT